MRFVKGWLPSLRGYADITVTLIPSFHLLSPPISSPPFTGSPTQYVGDLTRVPAEYVALGQFVLVHV
jgi:hypothetical protein